jgi:hypothetical protein
MPLATVKYLRDQRHIGVAAEIAKLRFPFPDEAHPDLETIVNTPTASMAVGQDTKGKDLFPDIVVVRRPGTWLQMMADVVMGDDITDETALTRWAPFSTCGELFIYAPYGRKNDVTGLCKKHGIRIAGVRVWRFRPVWGLEVAEA